MNILHLIIILWMAAGTAFASNLAGQVVGVSDGDTITVLDHDHQQHKVRLAGIDAPENGQPFGQRSKENLSRLVYGQQVNVQWKKHDRYQRIVGKVMVADSNCKATPCRKTLDAGLAQLTVGLAWWYSKYSSSNVPRLY